MKKIILLFFILFFIFSCESSIIDDINPKLIAKIDNYKIYIDDVKKRIYEDNERTVKITKPIMLFYLNEIIKEKIIYDEFKKAKLKITNKDKKDSPFLLKLNKEELERWIIFKKVKSHIVKKLTPPSKKECKIYYEKHKSLFNEKKRVKLKYIIFKNKMDADVFFQLAKNISIDKAIKDKNLSLTFQGIMNIENIPDDIKSKVNVEKEGSLWLVKSENKYYYVIKIEKFFKKTIPFFQIEDKICKKIFEEKRNKLFQLWLNNEIRNRNIKIYYNKLD